MYGLFGDITHRPASPASAPTPAGNFREGQKETLVGPVQLNEGGTGTVAKTFSLTVLTTEHL